MSKSFDFRRARPWEVALTVFALSAPFLLPLATPGILTGVILGLAQALGETAPLLLIGMVAFVRNFPAAPPEGLFDPASALPVQVYNWTQRADPAFVERASGAIIVLLVLLMCMNILAIFLRRKFERRW